MATQLQHALETLIALLGADATRYFTIIDVGGERVMRAPPEEVWLAARMGSWPHSSYGTHLRLATSSLTSTRRSCTKMRNMARAEWLPRWTL